MPNNKGSRRRFGAVRQYRSGRWTASYLGPEGTEHRSPQTFETKKDAEIWLSQVEADITRESWIDPDAGKVLFGPYAKQWVADHPKLAVSTRELYEILLRLHIGPTFQDKELRAIKEPNVRAWRSGLLKRGVGQVTVAKSYRLLRAILYTAADDGVIKRNPCRIKGGGDEHSPERPTLTLDEVFRVAEAIDPRCRAMVLIATFLGFRLGELAGLRRNSVDLDNELIHVRRVSGQTNKGLCTRRIPRARRAGAASPSRRRSFRRSRFTWTSSRARSRTRSCSLARAAARSAGTTSTASGSGPFAKPGPKMSIFMTFGTLGTHLRPLPARACVS